MTIDYAVRYVAECCSYGHESEEIYITHDFEGMADRLFTWLEKQVGTKQAYAMVKAAFRGLSGRI